MAITIHTQPQQYTPSDNPMVFTFSSDQTAQPNFSYIVDVKVNGQTIKQELIFPEQGINAKYDASSVASNRTSLPSLVDDFIADAGNYTIINIEVFERYGDPVQNEDSAISNFIITWKGKLSNKSFTNYSQFDYVAGFGGTGGQWLTEFPSPDVFQKVSRTNEQVRLMMILAGQNLNNIAVTLYDSNFGLIATDFTNFVHSNEQLLIFNMTPDIIVNEFAGISQANFDAAAYYGISIDSGAQMLPWLFELRDNVCTYPRAKRVHFMSQIGAIESYTFELFSRESYNTRDFGYKRNWGEWQDENYVFSDSQGEDISYTKLTEQSIELLSDWIPQETQQWLIQNLIRSPLVYLEEDGELKRRKITTSASSQKWQDNDTVFQERVTLGLNSERSMIV